MRAEQPGDLGEFRVAADEAGQLGTQVGVAGGPRYGGGFGGRRGGQVVGAQEVQVQGG